MNKIDNEGKTFRKILPKLKLDKPKKINNSTTSTEKKGEENERIKL